METCWAHDPKSVVRPRPPRHIKMKKTKLFFTWLANRLTSIKTAQADKRVISTNLCSVKAVYENVGVLREIPY